MQARIEHLPADLFGLSDVARAALAQGPAFAPLPVARKPEDVPRPPERHDKGQREQLALTLGKALGPLDPPERVRTSIKLLGMPGVFAVVTGQQPGFLMSPLYSLYKALQACRLAHELSNAWGSPVVPLFWNHADDHDVAEVHHSFLLNRNLDLQKVGLAGMSSGKIPIGHIELSEERHRLSGTRELLSQQYGEHPFCDEALDLLCPRPGETLARAMTRALTALLGEHGLVVVEPDWIRAGISHGLADVISTDPYPALVEGAQALEATGLSVGIDPTTAALVYAVDEKGRHPLRAGGEGFQYDGEPGSRTPHELAAEIVQDLDAWSPAALLRPLAQDAVFPTAAYVGGYGELAYLAQLGPVRERAGLPQTPFVPRIGITLADADLNYAASRVETSVADFLRAGGEIDAQNETPAPAVLEALRRTAQEASSALLAHKADLTEFDRALGANLKRTADQVRSLVDKLVQKGERVHANSSGKGRRQLRRLQNTLFPRDLPQERVLGPFVPYARYGKAWVEALYAELPPISTEHLLVHLETDEEDVT